MGSDGYGRTDGWVHDDHGNNKKWDLAASSYLYAKGQPEAPAGQPPFPPHFYSPPTHPPTHHLGAADPPIPPTPVSPTHPPTLTIWRQVTVLCAPPSVT